MNKIILDEEIKLQGQLLRYKKMCAQKALDMNIIPKDAIEEHIKIYVNNVIERLAGYEFMLNDWVDRIQKELNPENKKYSYDFNSGTLILHDEDSK